MSNLTITPGQALLLLMRHYQDDAAKMAELKKVYFIGTPYDAKLLDPFLADPVLAEYNITASLDAISNDPTRRYFESYFAKGILEHEIEKLDYVNVNRILSRLQQQFFPAAKYTVDYANAEAEFAAVKNGEYKGNHPSFIEYSTIISRVESDYPDLSSAEQNRIKNLFAISFISTLTCDVLGALLPVHIYGKGIFAKDRRGVYPKVPEHATSRTSAKGIMKSIMPLSYDDILFNEDELGQVRAPDRSTYDPNADWSKVIAQGKIHPFVNSISGTVLAILRTTIHQKKMKALPFDDINEITNYLRCMICALLYSTGGHCMFEYSFPMFLKDIQKAMFDVDGFDDLTFETFFVEGNEAAFDAALEETIEYNDKLLKQKAVNRQITSHKHFDETVPTPVQCSMIRGELIETVKEMNLPASLEGMIRSMAVTDDARALKNLNLAVMMITELESLVQAYQADASHGSVNLLGFKVGYKSFTGNRRGHAVHEQMYQVYKQLVQGESVTYTLHAIQALFHPGDLIGQCQDVVQTYESTRPEDPSTSPSDAPKV